MEEFENQTVEELDKRFELEDEVERAVNRLPEQVQTVFKMSRYQGMKNREIANSLDVSIKTVESRMTKAFTILRQQLKPFLILLIFFDYF